MQLYIPTLGDQLQLTENWTFEIWDEYRNKQFLSKYGELGPIKDLATNRWGYVYKGYTISLPKDTVLKVDRIYIRRTCKNFDSITFVVFGPKKLGRFWVKLSEANNIVFERVNA